MRSTSEIVDLDDTAWMAQADCATVDTEIFFPEHGGHLEPARLVCGGCPVQADCLDYALRHGDLDGVWGGLSYRQRQTERRRRGIVLHPNGWTVDDDLGRTA